MRPGNFAGQPGAAVFDAVDEGYSYAVNLGRDDCAAGAEAGSGPLIDHAKDDF